MVKLLVDDEGRDEEVSDQVHQVKGQAQGPADPVLERGIFLTVK